MEASIDAWLQGSSATTTQAGAQAPPQTQMGAQSLPTNRSSGGGGVVHDVPVSSTARPRHTVVPLRLPSNSSAREAPAARGNLATPMVCPLCHGVSAEAELSSPMLGGSPASADSPSPPAGASPASSAGASPTSGAGSGGERVQRRALRRVKRGRSINKVGKWWKMYGYNGPPYCQRCSEVFRDHIIRQISNSANCSRARPCTDCTQVLKHLPKPLEDVWAKMDRTKEARGARAPKQSKKSAAAVGLVQLSESYDGGEMSLSCAQYSPSAAAAAGSMGDAAHTDSSGGGVSDGHDHNSPQYKMGREAVLPTLRACSLDGRSVRRVVLPTLRASSLDGGSLPLRVTVDGDR